MKLSASQKPLLPQPPAPETGQIWLECLIGCVFILVALGGVTFLYVGRYQSYQAELAAHPQVRMPPPRPSRSAH